MPNPLRAEDFIKEKAIKDSINAIVLEFDKASKAIIEDVRAIKKETKSIKLTDDKAAKNLVKQEQLLKTAKVSLSQLNVVKKELISLEKQEATTKAKLATAMSTQGQRTRQLKMALADANRVQRRNVQLNQSASGSMRQLSLRLGENRDRYRKLSQAERENINIGGRLLRTIQAQDTEIKKLDASIGNNQRSVGNYGIALQGVTRVMGALGFAGGITLVVRGLREMVGVFTEFELSAAKVRAISGATDAEFKDLTDDAKRLGESTEQTASSVAGLQLQYAKLGFTTQQILDATEATLNLATAADEDLANAARVTGNTLRAFGLDADQAARLTDVMARAFTGSALDLEKFSVSMRQVAPVARKFGFSVEDTTALLAELSNAGFDASQAGTATRNILLNLADANGKLAKELGEPVKTLPELVEGLKKLEENGIDLADALELTDKRSVAAFATFISGADSVLAFSGELENAEGAAAAMAEIMRDTLSGDTDKATSAMEGFAIQIGEKLAPLLRAAVQQFTTFIGILAGTVVAFDTVGKAFDRQLAMDVETIESNRNVAASANALVDEYESLTADGVEPTEESKMRLDEITVLLSDHFGDSVVAINSETGAMGLNLEATKEMIKQRLLLSNQTASTLALQLNTTEGNIKSITEERKAILKQIDIRRRLLAQEIEAEKVRRNSQGSEMLTLIVKDRSKNFAHLRGLNVELGKANKNLAEQDRERIELLRQLNKLGFDAADVEKLFTLEINKSAQAGGTNNTVKKKTVKVTTDLIKLKREEIKAAQDISATTKEEVRVRNEKVDVLKEELKVLQALGAQNEELEKARMELRDAEVENVENDLRRLENSELDKLNRKRQALEEERDLLIKQGADEAITTELFNDLITEIELNHEKSLAQKRKDFRIKAQAELHRDEQKELETLLLNQGFAEEEIRGALRDERVADLEDEITLRQRLGEESIDQELELARLQRDIDNDRVDDRKQTEKELLEISKAAIGIAIDELKRKSQAAVEAADEEVRAVDQRIAEQQQLAAQGLENSLKHEQENRAQALQAKLDAEKKKQTAEKISAFWNLVANSENVLEAIGKFGVGEAFARTIQSLPGFAEGGETPGKPTLAIVGEKGKEWISTAGTTKKYLPELQAMHQGGDAYANLLADKYVQPNIPSFGAVTSTASQDLSPIKDEIRGLKDEFKNAIPKFESLYDQNTQQMITISKSRGRKVTTKYKL